MLDRVISDRNLKKMADFFSTRSAKLRPHFKNHKCVTLAKRQLDAGNAIGMTCAKLGEAEILADHGFKDLLVANQVVGAAKVNRLIEVAKKAKISVAVDHIDQVRAISAAATAAGVTVHLLVEVNIGMNRCGVEPGEPTLDFVRQILPLPGVQFAGIQAFEGHLVNVLDRSERKLRAIADMTKAIETRRLLERNGIPVGCISGCSSSTYDVTGVMDGVDEVQAGTYVTMDRQYHRLVPEFEIALSIQVRVISLPAPGKAVLDIGVKGAGAEFGVPSLRDYPDVEVPGFLSEEHVVILKAPDWKMGDVVHLVPSHACTTCNLYREIIVHENGIVVDIWPIEASGKLS
jgi:D-serine deaminase-like pyridoxal phosphate-dependent protein